MRRRARRARDRCSPDAARAARWCKSKAHGTRRARRRGSTGCACTTCGTATPASSSAGGASLSLIGALLGHSNPKTTSRYAHMFDDPQRAATERVGALIAAAGAAGRASAAVLPLRKGGRA